MTSTSCHRWALCRKYTLILHQLNHRLTTETVYWASSASIIFCLTWIEDTFINAFVFLISFLSFSLFILGGTECGVHICIILLYIMLYHIHVMFFFDCSQISFWVPSLQISFLRLKSKLWTHGLQVLLDQNLSFCYIYGFFHPFFPCIWLWNGKITT